MGKTVFHLLYTLHLESQPNPVYFCRYQSLALRDHHLLTRCRNASSCFLLFLYSRKASLEIFSELDETWTEPPIFPTRRRSPEETRRGATWRPHHGAARAPLRTVGWCGALVAPQPPPFRLFILPGAKTLNTRAIIHEKFQRRRRRQP